MAFSVNTNVGAMAALQSLTATNKDLATTQSRINTGLNVASTKDDSATYAIAQGLRGDLGGLKSVSSSLSRAKSVVDVATAGAEQISDVVNQMKAKAYQAADAGIDTNSRDAINKDFTALRDQITTIVNSSDFNGTNLLKASGGSVTALQSLKDGNTGTTTWDPDSLSVSNLGRPRRFGDHRRCERPGRYGCQCPGDDRHADHDAVEPDDRSRSAGLGFAQD